MVRKGIEMSEESKNTEESTAKSRRLTDKKKKKIRHIRIYDIILVLLIGVMLYSGYQIAGKLIEYRKAEKAYTGLESEVVKLVDGPVFYPVGTRPANNPENSAQTQADPAETQPDASDPSASSRPSYVDGSLPPDMTRPDREPETQATKPSQIYASPTQKLPWLDVNFPALWEKNGDVVAWLYGQDGEINLPVVQGRNNDYYLHRLLDGTWNFAGTLFVDYRNNFLEDDVTIIYGHKMRNKSMFGKLDLYDSYDYYKTHPVMRLYTPTAIYELQIMASVYTTVWDEPVRVYDSEEAFREGIQSYLDRAVYTTGVTAEYGDKLVCLYTCAYQVTDGRLYMICKLVQIA